MKRRQVHHKNYLNEWNDFFHDRKLRGEYYWPQCDRSLFGGLSGWCVDHNRGSYLHVNVPRLPALSYDVKCCHINKKSDILGFRKVEAKHVKPVVRVFDVLRVAQVLGPIVRGCFSGRFRRIVKYEKFLEVRQSREERRKWRNSEERTSVSKRIGDEIGKLTWASMSPWPTHPS